MRLNVAAILREDKQLQKRQEEEEKRLKDLEWNMRDSAEFDNWKQEHKYKEKIEQIEHQQRKKYEMELAREAGIKAFEDKVNDNKATASHMKHISKINGVHRMQLKQEDAVEKKKLIQTVLDTRENVEIEQQRVSN